MSNPYRTRFAPTTSGYVHPGTLLSGLLCWLAARNQGGSVFLRLENLDRQRCRPEYQEAMIRDLAWFGLSWDEMILQDALTPQHEEAMDTLEELDLLYPCSCSRAHIKEINRRAPDGGYVYDNHCRARKLPTGGWRSCRETIRFRLPPDEVTLTDLTGLLIKQNPISDMGDPIVRRREGCISYHLACVVDDAHAGVTELIRGYDLAASAPTQYLLRQSLGFAHPTYRHHLLLLEAIDQKLAKLHGSISVPEMKSHLSPEKLCGLLAHWSGLTSDDHEISPKELVPHFSWERLRKKNVIVAWDDHQLRATL